MQDSGAPKQPKERDPFARPVGGFAGVVSFLRSLPARLRRPESLLMLMAMLASLGAHMPPYVGLGALADYFERTETKQEKQKPVEVSFEVNDTPPEVAPPPAEPEVQPAPNKQRPIKKKPQPKQEQAKEEPKPEERKVAQLELPKPALPEPPPPSPERKQSITQKSDDPSVEPPPNAEYLAEENRRVLEETVAKITDETKNDPEPQAAAPQAEGPEESGDSHQDERGQEKGREQAEQVASVARPEQPPAPALPQRPSVTRQAPKQEVAPAPVIVRDPMGTFVLTPTRPAQRGQAGREGQAGAPNAAAPNLKVSWSAFEQTYGAEQLAQDRMPKEAKRRGAGREKRWSEFRAAIENYISGVKPGNMTALNAAADPFAAYLAAFHRNLHTEFVHEFIASLPVSGDLADDSLVAKVEIVVNPDGTLDRVGVVKSSGNLMYDFGAFNAVQRGAPYPPPPEKIRSPDGRTYMRWALHRDQSQCGTWNAEPYILKTPPRSPNDPPQDSVSPYRPGGSDPEQGRRVPSEPGKGKGKGGGSAPAVSPGDTLGRLFPRRRLQPV